MGTLSFPSVVSIENNLSCNGHCSFCIRKHITRKKGVMSIELAQIIANQLTKDTVVILNSWNEPTITNNFEQFLKIFDKQQIMFYTNGSLLHRKSCVTGNSLIEDIAESKAIKAIYISFNGGNKDSYEKVMGIDYNNSFYNAMYLFDAVELKIPIFITANVVEDNKASMKYLYKLFPYAGRIETHIPWDVRGLRGRQQPIDKVKYCNRLDYYLSVAWDGKVQSCCNSVNNEVVFGDLNIQTIEEVWNGKKAQEFRELHTTKKRSEIPLCERCIG